MQTMGVEHQVPSVQLGEERIFDPPHRCGRQPLDGVEPQVVEAGVVIRDHADLGLTPRWHVLIRRLP